MAKAYICDNCGETYAFRGEVLATGRWSRITREKDGVIVKLVFASFKLSTPEEAKMARGGTPIDLCNNCVVDMVVGDSKKVLTNS